MSDEKVLLLKKSDGTPTIEVIIGHANWGTYKFKLWDKNGKNPKTIGSGFSGDDVDDEFKIGSVSSINGRYLSWKIAAAGFDEGEQEQYQFTVLIRQKNKTVANGVYTYSGVLKGVKTEGGFVKLKIV